MINYTQEGYLFLTFKKELDAIPVGQYSLDKVIDLATDFAMRTMRIPLTQLSVIRATIERPLVKRAQLEDLGVDTVSVRHSSAVADVYNGTIGLDSVKSFLKFLIDAILDFIYNLE